MRFPPMRTVSFTLSASVGAVAAELILPPRSQPDRPNVLFAYIVDC